MLNRPICVYCHGQWRTPYGERYHGEPIHLLYTPDGGSSGHYEALIPQGSGGGLKRPDSPTEHEEPGPPQKFSASANSDSSASSELFTCRCCGKEYDGNAQCSCMCQGCLACDPSSLKDHYEVLGLESTASPDEIRQAFRKLSLQHHPDKGGSTESFQRLQAAYDTLSDPGKRQNYDEHGNSSDDSDIPLSSDNEGCDGDDGDQPVEQTEEEEQQPKKTPIEICLMSVLDYAKKNGIIREKNPKTGETMLSKEACEYLDGTNCRYYEPLRTKKGKVMTMSQWLNAVMKEVPGLQSFLVRKGTPLRNNLIKMLQESQLPDWDILEFRDQGIISFNDGYLDFARRDERGRPSWRFVINDGAEDHRIAPVHFDVEFPLADDYYGFTHEQFREKCPAFDQVLKSQPELENCKGALTFDDPTRAADSRDFTGTELFLFALTRSLMPYNDRLKFMPWVLGATGAGKTEIFQALLERLLGSVYIQIIQDGEYGDKFTVNEKLLDMSLIVFSDTRGTPLTSEQLCKLANHEKMATRGMREIASDAEANANAIAFTNVQPQWKDDCGAVIARLMVIMLQPVESPDATLPDRLPRETPWILLTMLDAYRRVAAHVLPSPYKQWIHPLFSLSRQVQESEHPLADILINHLGEEIPCADGSTLTVTAEPAPIGKAPVEKVQEAITAHCARISLAPVPRVDRRKDETELRALLSRCSSLIDGEALVLCSRRHVWKCGECDAVAAVSDQSASEDWGCEHCDAGCKDASLTRVTTEKQPQPYIRNLRVRQEAAMAGFFGDLPNGGRGAGYDTPAVDNEGVVVTDAISTLPLDKVAKLSPTSEVAAAFDPAAAVWNDPYLRHKILLANVHEELHSMVPHFNLCRNLLRHVLKTKEMIAEAAWRQHIWEPCELAWCPIAFVNVYGTVVGSHVAADHATYDHAHVTNNMRSAWYFQLRNIEVPEIC
eukprot:COSAG02_NODE_3395_length_6814_cov_8.576620_5_plen_948_part_00